MQPVPAPAAAERDVLEALELDGEHQRRDVDGELLRRLRHVGLPPAAPLAVAVQSGPMRKRILKPGFRVFTP